MNWAYVAPIVLLCISNVFMTFAWYGQFNYPTTSLWLLVPISWGIAFFEYCFAVPANHLGHTVYSAAQLKTISGSHHRCRIRSLFRALSGRAAEMELRCLFHAARGGGLFRFREILAREKSN